MRQVAGKRHRGFSLQRKEAVAGWLFVTPVMIGVLVFTAFSMVYSLYISFTDWNILSDPHFVGLQNYKNLFTRDIFFWDYLWNTFYYVLVLGPFVLVISLLFAILLNKQVKGPPYFPLWPWRLDGSGCSTVSPASSTGCCEWLALRIRPNGCWISAGPSCPSASCASGR